MWSRVREAVMGIAEQAGIEVPGLDSASTAVTDLAASAGDAASSVASELAVSDLSAPIADAADSVAPGDLVTTAADAAAGAGESVTAVIADASSTVGGLHAALKDRLIP